MERTFDFKTQGKPEVDLSKCTGCAFCVQVCPDQVWSITGDKAQPGKGFFLGCFACGQCVAVCPERCITVTGRRMETTDAIALPPKEKRASGEALESLFLSRRSIRKFRSRPIERSMVEHMLRMASTAPMGIPPHNVGVVVFHGKEAVQGLSKDTVATYRRMRKFVTPTTLTLARPFFKATKHEIWRDFILPLADNLIDNDNRGKDKVTYGAPLAFLFHHTPYADSSDTAIVATYAMLAAESLGLGTCLLGTTAALNMNSHFKMKHQIPKENQISLGLLAGWTTVNYERAVVRKLVSTKWVE